MFTTALPSPDRRRRPAAFVLALSINGSIFAGLLSIQQTEAALPVPEQVEAYYEIMVPVAMPAATPAPAPRGGSRSSAPARSTLAPTPLLTPQALPDASLVPVIAVQLEPMGLGGAGGTGPEGPGGPGPGGPGGPGGADGTGGGRALREMPSDVLKVRSQVSPEFPRAAHALSVNEATCTVHLAVDARGRPTAAEVTGCPDMFAAPAQEAAMKWRFAPLYIGETAVSAHFRINFQFKYGR